MKLNIASGNKRIEGYTNVDVQQLPNVDIVWDLTQFPYPFESESIEEIVSQETLEHITFRKISWVLHEWHRILRVGAKVKIQVPDIGKMCEYYANGLICDCVPRKAESYYAYRADPNCFKCSGKALIHPERWSVAFTGAQKHPWDAHLNVFTKQSMEDLLYRVGFENVSFEENIYKIIVTAEKI